MVLEGKKLPCEIFLQGFESSDASHFPVSHGEITGNKNNAVKIDHIIHKIGWH